MYSFTPSNDSLLKNGQKFFVSPIANPCMASLHVGLVLPDPNSLKNDYGLGDGHSGLNWGVARTEVVVAGGNCCSGYLIAISPEGQITKILAIDFNVRRIVPIIHKVVYDNGDGAKEGVELGLLVSGAGCDGKGARFVDFRGVTPTSTPVIKTEEEVKSYETWLYGGDPLTVSDIWDRLEKIGINVDRQQTEKAAKSFSTF